MNGLSARDVEEILADALGDRAAISKSTVSAACQQIKDEMHPGSPAEPVLAVWGITPPTSPPLPWASLGRSPPGHAGGICRRGCVAGEWDRQSLWF